MWKRCSRQHGVKHSKNTTLGVWKQLQGGKKYDCHYRHICGKVIQDGVNVMIKVNSDGKLPFQLQIQFLSLNCSVSEYYGI